MASMVTVEVYRTGHPAEKIRAIELLREAAGFNLPNAAGLLGRLQWHGTPFTVELAGQREADEFASRLAMLGYGCCVARPREPA
jgi:hypothetical protein